MSITLESELTEWKLSDLHYESAGRAGKRYAKITISDGSIAKVIARDLCVYPGAEQKSHQSPILFKANRSAKMKVEIRNRWKQSRGEVEVGVEQFFTEDETVLDVIDLKQVVVGRLHMTVHCLNLDDIADVVAQDSLTTSPVPSPLERTSKIVESVDKIVNKTTTLTDNLNTICQKLEFLQGLGDFLSEVHPYAKFAWSVLSFIPKEVKLQLELEENIISLTETMRDIFDLILKSEEVPRARSKVILRLIQQTIECGWFIRDYQKIKTFWKKTMKRGTIENEVKVFKDKFNELCTAFTAETALKVEIAVLRIADMSKALDDHIVEERLKDMRYSKNARFNPEKICLPSTRLAVLDEIFRWITSASPSESILLLHGQAGSGKSAIANTISLMLSETARLGASYCFSRDDRVDRNAENFFSTIANSIAHLDRTYRCELFRAIEDMGIRFSNVPSVQFNEFILKPMQSLTTVGVIIAVVDAFDECDNRESILKVLSRCDFPENLRLIITTRPEDDIMTLKDMPHVHTLDVNTFTRDSVFTDIKTYIHHRFRGDSAAIHTSDLEQLTSKAEGLFQWAATACDYIKNATGKAGANTQKRLRDVLSKGSGLDSLYSVVMNDKFPDDESEIQSAKSALSIVLAAAEPLSIFHLQDLCQSDAEKGALHDTLPALGSLFTGTDGKDAVRPVHTSLRDYLTDQSRSNKYWIDIKEGHRRLATASFMTMKSGLKFNICQIGSSYSSNSQLTDEELSRISPTLLYSCQFWADHLNHSSSPNRMREYVSDFMHNLLMFWLEVLSIKMLLNSAIPVFESFVNSEIEWQDSSIVPLARDTISMLRNFSVPIRTSAPHIYISALALVPKSSTIFHQYTQKLNLLQCMTNDHVKSIQVILSLPNVARSVASSQDGRRIVTGSYDGMVQVWDIEKLEQIGEPLTGHEGSVNSVALSQDGRRIASTADDGTIRVWNTEKLEQIGEPLTGHKDSVTSVAFSPDGQRIVTGSDDKTVRVWDAEKFEQIGEPLTGHDDSVLCVAFSPDGQRIVSGSFDKTIRVWDAEKLEQIGKPLMGHNKSVISVAFSPDGWHIVSGSYDSTIQVWDAEKLEQIGEPLTGHSALVNSVAFSQDGRRIVSGSYDHSVRVWDTEKLEQIGEPLTGHNSSVFSVAFSQDGQRIVSGSYDQTVRVWDAEKLEQIDKPLAGHNDRVSSVAFSPDGRHIVSGSDDKTIWVWDAEKLEQIGKPLAGHKGSVISVAFSPDGRRIVSGSFDKTIRVWDAEKLEQIGEPLTSHNELVFSVAFSPDGWRIVSGSYDNTIRIWDAEKLEQIGEPLTGHTASVYSVAFSQDGRYIVSGSADQSVRVWDAEKLKQIGEPLNGHNGLVRSAAFSHDRRHIVSCSDDRTIRVWDAEKLDQIGKALTSDVHSVLSVAFSPDGRHIVSGSFDHTVRVWGAQKLEQIGNPLAGHNDPVWSVAFSPDGRHIVSGSSDRTIRVWDAESLEASIVKPKCLTNRISVFSHVSNSSYLHPDNYLSDNGWVIGPNSERLFWVPAYLRSTFPMPYSLGILGKESLDQYDDSKFVHGEQWTKCFEGRSTSGHSIL